MLKKPRALCTKYADCMIRISCTSFSHSIALRSENKLSSMSLIQYLVSLQLGVQSQIEEFLEIEKVYQNGISGIEGSYDCLTSVGKLFNKVVRIPNGGKKMRNISVFYRF